MADKDKTEDKAPEKVLGLRGEPVNLPSGRWYAQVDDAGRVRREDGLLVKAKD